MKSRIFIAIIALIGVGVGVYFLVHWLNKSPGNVTPHDPGPAITRQVAEVPAIRFTDVTPGSGIKFKHENGATPQKLLPETMGGGVAVIDFDGDGKPDLLFVNSKPWPGHAKPGDPTSTLKLYRNLGDYKFEDVTEKVGLNVSMYGMGVCVGDFDNDGWPDIFISCVGKNHLFHNEKGKGFEEVTLEAGVGGPIDLPNVSKEEFLKWKEPIPFGTSCTFLDFDGDGLLDIFVCHYVTWSPAIDLSVGSTLTGGTRTYQQPQQLEGSQCTLYRNLGGGKFEDVSQKAGVIVTSKEGVDAGARERNVGKSLGVIVCDPDGDGWPDIIVANDTVRNFFFHNEPAPGGGRMFKEMGLNVGAAYADEGRPRGGMGIDWGEFAPSRSAAVIANFADEPLTMIENHSANKLLFSDCASMVGLGGPSRNPLKFGTFFFDYDNDGRLDMLVNNGHIDPDISKIQSTQRYAQPPQLYWNSGNADCYFEPVSAKEAGDDLFKPIVGRGSAFADLNGSGRLDVIIAANGGEPRILRNDAPNDNHWVKLDLRGDGERSNRSAIGATVTIQAGDLTLHRQVTSGRGYLSQSELVLTVGVGKATKIDRVVVQWPGKSAGREAWGGLAIEKLHVLKQGEGSRTQVQLLQGDE
jgi:enediyne biosynthesis protein E4